MVSKETQLLGTIGPEQETVLSSCVAALALYQRPLVTFIELNPIKLSACFMLDLELRVQVLHK